MMAIDINMQDLLDILNEGRAHVKVEMSAEDLKAFSEDLIRRAKDELGSMVEAAKKAKVVISIEEHAPFGGLGSMVSQVVGAECPRKVVNMSLPDAPVITGTSKEVFDYYGLNAEGIAKKAKELLD